MDWRSWCRDWLAPRGLSLYRRGLILGIVETESGFNPSAVGALGERGLGQIMPATAAGLGYTGTADGLSDPAVNLELVAALIDELWAGTGGNESETVSAYNCGLTPRGVSRCRRSDGSYSNQAYIDRVLTAAAWWIAELEAGSPEPVAGALERSDAAVATGAALGSIFPWWWIVLLAGLLILGVLAW